MARKLAAAFAVAVLATAATRPHYGGTLRIELRDVEDSPDPPTAGSTLAQLSRAFTITRWEAGHRAVFLATENASGGRPFLDSIDIEFARPLRDQSIDLELGKTDVIELGATELRRAAPGRRVWTSANVRLIALVFGARVDDARVREALNLAVDRAAIHNVLLQRQGEISAGLLPQWLSGFAFLFSTSTDLARARALVAGSSASQRTLTLGVEDPSWQPVAARIAVNARDAGLTLTPAAINSTADVRLVERRLVSTDPARALAVVAAALGLADPPRMDSADAIYAAEKSLLEGSRVIPLFHLPETYGAAPRVKGGPAITPLGEWRFENLWIESGRP